MPTSQIDRLLDIMHTLRAPGGCPWDIEQTHQSLIPCLLEEAYEVAEALREDDSEAMADELGDLLLQVIFHAEIANETKRFDFEDVAKAICDKLVRRHPHVFGDSDVTDTAGVLRQWEEIKQQEKGSDQRSYHLKRANDGLPSLMAAKKLQKKAAEVGFDWPDLDPVVDKIHEELAEVEEALAEDDHQHLGEEIGDLLFSIVNLARKNHFDPEALLAATNSKFVKRFQKVEDLLKAENKTLTESSLEEMDAKWEQAKLNS
ncbi:MAG: nucleoside triphosphate pyrophosphohydrolase [Verrucomicrobiales bacterium]|nr:nucleoside triphosphate pyrophosphohydrolase [Verrucomicrobiales bacterium]